MRQEKGVQCARFLKARGESVPMGENPTPRSIWWGRADWFVFVPWFLVLASFWIYLFGPDRAPWTEAIHAFYRMRHTAETRTPWMMLGSLLSMPCSCTLCLGRW